MTLIWTPTGLTEIESAEDLFYVDINFATASKGDIELMIQTNIVANNWINGGEKIDDYLDCLSDGGYNAYEFLSSVKQSLVQKLWL